MRFKAILPIMFALLNATTVNAALFVSGDSNILNDLASKTANQALFTNITGTGNIVVQNSTRQFLDYQAGELVSWYLTHDHTASLLSEAAAIEATTLASATLFVASAPDNGFAAGEVAELGTFLSNGANIIVTGDNDTIIGLKEVVNDLLSGLGSGMRIVPQTIDAGFFPATLQGPSPYILGTTGFEYAATSEVTGGVGLYGTYFTNTTFLAVEEEVVVTPTVPSRRRGCSWSPVSV